jgi:hypothetical protein
MLEDEECGEEGGGARYEKYYRNIRDSYPIIHSFRIVGL